MWPWKKNLESKEYRELKQQIELLWMELDILTQRYKRKATRKADETPEETKGAAHDPFDEVRKLNKELNP